MTETHTSLTIMSKKITGQEINKLLDFNNTEIYDIGDFRRIGKVFKRTPEKENSWIVKSELGFDEDFDNHVNNILSQLDDILKNFHKLNGLTKNILSCAIYFTSDGQYDYKIDFYLEKETVKKLSDLNVNISYEIYVLDKGFKEKFVSYLLNIKSFFKTPNKALNTNM